MVSPAAFKSLLEILSRLAADLLSFILPICVLVFNFCKSNVSEIKYL